MFREIFIPRNIETYLKDNRLPIVQLYERYLLLFKEGWKTDLIYTQEVSSGGKNVLLPVYSFRTPAIAKKGLIILAGVHGEEPAPPIAFSENIDFFIELGQRGIPMVILPLLNPLGYILNQRYPNKFNESVGNCDHCLPGIKNQNSARSSAPACPEAEKLSRYIIKIVRERQPVLWINHHEDLSDEKDRHLFGQVYIYSQGLLGFEDPVAQKIRNIIIEEGYKLAQGGDTQFGEPIKKGIVSVDEEGLPIRDGSLEELAAAGEVFIRGKLVRKHPILSVITAETATNGNRLNHRIKTHTRIIRSYPEFWETAKDIIDII